jgi:hypothetical protein
MSKICDARGGRSARIVLVALFASCAAEVTVGVVGAGAAPPPLNVSPQGNLHDGQSISLTVGPNSYFTPHARVNILECADPGGAVANLPKDITTCDGNTVQGTTILVANDGSFSESAYSVYLLPNSALGEQPNGQPICDKTNPCVLYVGQDQNDFTAPKVFSAPFLITQGSATTTTTVAQTNSGGNAATSSTAVGPAASSGTTGTSGGLATSATSASAALANTGPPAALAWVGAMGMALVVTGALGRRRALRRSR